MATYQETEVIFYLWINLKYSSLGTLGACLVPLFEFSFLYSKRGSHHKIFCLATELCFCI